MTDILFDDVMEVYEVDKEAKKYDKVSRIEARSEGADVYMQLDVNSEVYPMHAREMYRMVLAPTLSLDGSPTTAYVPEGKQRSLADKFEYVMHGLLYKTAEEKAKAENRMVVYVSFGGLQLMLKGPFSKMHKLKVDQRMFLLLRKI